MTFIAPEQKGETMDDQFRDDTKKMRALIDKQDALVALNEWEDCYTWDDWTNEHKVEAKYKIISPSSVIQNMPTKPDYGKDWKKAYYENAYSQGYTDGYLMGKKDQMRQKTGKWLDNPITAHSLAKHCSRCGYVCLGYDSITGARFQYCPSCGAKMLKEGERIDS